ncbi:MAG: glycosyltransferase family protein [Arenicella sp.]
MRQKILVVSSRKHLVIPATACLIEFEQVLVSAFNADLLAVYEAGDFSERQYDAIIFIAMSYSQLSEMMLAVEKKVSFKVAIAYVFDAFTPKKINVLPMMSHKFIPKLRVLRRFDVIYSPMKLLIASQSKTLQANITYLPIGVDALKHGAHEEVEQRFISVNGYGRQPPSISQYFADQCNTLGKDIYYHTDHMKIAGLHDYVRHRQLFWKLLRSSKIALAYAPEYYDPAGRFECSFVGQRWYEAMAAGCVVVGRSPSAKETNEIFSWKNALIDIAEDPSKAWEDVQNLLNDEELLLEVSRLNFLNTLKQHDWRIRVKLIAETFSLKLSDSFNAEYDSILEACLV